MDDERPGKKEGRENDGDIIGEAKLVQIGNSVRWRERGEENFLRSQQQTRGIPCAREKSQKKRESVKNGGLGAREKRA